ncbi:hypothetical protein [Deinococcus marmoris]|uniref:N-acetyltransferase domain-containing protein n=1 Tax=Deinococcus marmoris TaxID=249408 RepID=A0A1U7NZY9_9DEIO|nr:hypothetical protein [Deinococcus marmoris]OLV18470.1 hypothetical protein BOO71_0005551 [Deinococcus marmoris]
MSFEIQALPPAELLPAFAALYGASQEDLTWMADACTAGFVALGDGEELLGAIGTRPSPQHGAELVGGVFPGPQRDQVALALIRAAHEAVGRVYVFAEGYLFPPEALLAAGLREVGAYRRLSGRVPYRHVDPPAGVQLLPLAGVLDAAARLKALRTYEDRVGHHAVTSGATADGAGGFDSHLSVIALNDTGRGLGVCRAAIEDGEARIDSPGVASEWRHTHLRAALLNEVNTRLRAAGITRVNVDSWGDTAEELAHDLKLGLDIREETPILALG